MQCLKTCVVSVSLIYPEDKKLKHGTEPLSTTKQKGTCNMAAIPGHRSKWTVPVDFAREVSITEMMKEASEIVCDIAAVEALVELVAVGLKLN